MSKRIMNHTFTSIAVVSIVALILSAAQVPLVGLTLLYVAAIAIEVNN